MKPPSHPIETTLHPPPPRSSPRRGPARSVPARAFTLIELLVVIAIIAIMAALLLPALTRAQAQARSIACISNLRQVGIALNVFANENGSYPVHGYQSANDPWRTQFGDTMGGARRIYICPAHTHSLHSTNTVVFGQIVLFSYGYNVWGCGIGGELGLDRGFPLSPVREAEVLVPADMIAFGDSQDLPDYSLSLIIPTFGFDAGNYFESWGPSKRHNRGANMVFCDGHAEHGKNARWVAHRADVMQRWNRDHQPHPELWTVNLLELDP
jgi:prepilin-type N-terminal cleavage/methylation domain-containing protein/prepilin-type processing-associated H-X9-DG protein